MEKHEKIFIAENCPNCGDSIIVSTECAEEDDNEFEQWFCDGDDARCAANCGFISCISVDGEAGEAWVQDGNIEELD